MAAAATVVAFKSASPTAGAARQHRAYQRSRRFAAVAWLALFVAPFGMLLGVPFRTLIPWNLLVIDLCKRNIQEVAATAPTALDLLREAALEGRVHESWAEPAHPENPFCETFEWEWDTQFFDVDAAALSADIEYCSNAFYENSLVSGAANLVTECGPAIQACTDTACQVCQAEATSMMRGGNVNCDDLESFQTYMAARDCLGDDSSSAAMLQCTVPYICTNYDGDIDAAFDDLESQADAGGADLCPADCDVSLCSITPETMKRYDDFLKMMKMSAASAEKSIEVAEYLVGIIMSLFAVKLLMPPALSLTLGIFTAMKSIKIFLMHDMGMLGMLMVLLAATTVPLFSAFLATLFQIIGDAYLVPTIVLLILGLLMMGVLGSALRKLHHPSQRAALRSTAGWISTLQLACIAGAAVCFVLYVYGSDSRFMQELNITSLFEPTAILNMVITTMSTMFLAKIVFTDAVFEMLGAAEIRRDEYARKKDDDKAEAESGDEISWPVARLILLKIWRAAHYGERHSDAAEKKNMKAVGPQE